MNTISITKHIDIRWKINGYEDYGFGEDKNLYNMKTCRKIKKTVVGYSTGFWISKKFITLKALKSMLTKIEKIETPL